MGYGRWFDSHDNSLRTFIVSLLSAISLGVLSWFCLFHLQLKIGAGDGWRALFGLGAFIHLVATLTDEESAGTDPSLRNLLFSFGPLFGLILLHTDRPRNFFEAFPTIFLGLYIAVCAFHWAMIVNRIVRYGIDHDFEPVIDEVE